MASEWMPREEWEALVRGEECPLCDAVAETVPENAYGTAVADLRVSRLRLSSNQWVAGYCVLIAKTHVREPHELPREERVAFFEDLIQASAAIEQVVGADKMNVQILGNSVPHLHAHLIPRFYGDPAPGRPLDPNLGQLILAPEDIAQRISALQGVLATQNRGMSDDD